LLSAGDHVLVTDNVYRPSRNFCNGMLARYGVEVSYFDPLIGAGIESVQAQHQGGAGRGARLAVV
jgi:cystathionine beta-lyase